MCPAPAWGIFGNFMCKWTVFTLSMAREALSFGGYSES